MSQVDSDKKREGSGKPKIWKIRTIKNYPEAHNHLLVGKVLEINDSYIRLHCRSYHFGGEVKGPDDIEIGDLAIRVVPWSRIEIINELPSEFDYIRNTLIADKVGQVLFRDGRHTSPIGYRSARDYKVQY